MKKSKKLSKFYHFHQNNSGGRFLFDAKKGISTNVIVEGLSVEDIIRRAEDIGLYWNGVWQGIDCGCCGDRWSQPWGANGLDPKPLIYGEDPRKVKDLIRWQGGKKPEIFIHYLNGKIEGILPKERKE